MSETLLGKRKERATGDDAQPSTEPKSEHGSTLFVSNLPYTATSTDLQTLFSDLAPVRSAFVVTEQGTGVSKGVGYVAFSAREGAQVALDSVNEEGIVLDGRKLRVTWADKKPKEKPKASVSAAPQPSSSKPRPQKTPYAQKPKDSDAIRTIVISGLPAGLDSKTLWKKLRKYPGAENPRFPLTRDDGSEDASSAHVLFDSPAYAQDAVNKLHAHIYKGALLSVVLKKRLDTVSTTAQPAVSSSSSKTIAYQLTPGDAEPSAPTPAPSRASRLIVRNLPFDISTQDLRALFLPYGPIHSIDLPLAAPSPSTSSPTKSRTKAKPKEASDDSSDDSEDDAHESDGDNDDESVKEEQEQQDEAFPSAPAPAKSARSKGFAFVWMLSRPDAQKALDALNGTRVRAGLAQDLARGKQMRKKDRREEEKRKRGVVGVKKEEGAEGGVEEVKEEEGEKDAMDVDEKEEEGGKGKPGERTIAVDWALSKGRWEEEKARLEVNAEEQGDVEMEPAASGSESGSSGSESDSDGEDVEEDEDDELGVHDGHSGSEDEEDEDEDGEDEDDEDARSDGGAQQSRPQLPSTDVGTTLFVRNIPFEATEDELRTLFRAFGPLRYARITVDTATGRSRGTGFACFWNREDADAVLERADAIRKETEGTDDKQPNPNAKRDHRVLPSILTADPSAPLTRGLVLHSRTLDVVRAVTRESAAKLAADGVRAREKADKRNMYLLREGVILPNMPAASSLTPAEVDKRTKSFDARRVLLRSNPALYVSRTRLSVRQIPLYVSERGLRRLAVHAMRTFEKEVKAGHREGLNEDEKEVREGDAGFGGEGEDAAAGVKPEEGASGDEGGDGKKKVLRKSKAKFLKDGPVKQSKIVRQAERVDAVTGRLRSRGYGFVEMRTHADALRVLRWANNNPAVGVLARRFWADELRGIIKLGTAGLKGKAPDAASGKGGKKKGEKSGEDGEDEGKKDEADARLKRLKDELERIEHELEAGKEGKDGKNTLIVEFSIENVQVVKRRAVREQDSRGGGGGQSSGTGAGHGGSRERRGPPQHRAAGKHDKKTKKEDRDEGKERPPKKRRMSGASEHASPGKKPKADGKEKTDPNIASIIGRKRKERKGHQVSATTGDDLDASKVETSFLAPLRLLTLRTHYFSVLGPKIADMSAYRMPLSVQLEVYYAFQAQDYISVLKAFLAVYDWSKCSAAKNALRLSVTTSSLVINIDREINLIWLNLGRTYSYGLSHITGKLRYGGIFLSVLLAYITVQVSLQTPIPLKCKLLFFTQTLFQPTVV
ncbi:hypothetical protein CONPUDRAFT_147133 [Coniophora puteana RWD-64-598 SS2]|uniref:RRM domain-containing protein n=1 Tax=Coniophora puteana (strain RWD-64-598) TaxID=741705 RepID=A0A5M3M9F7_CONPW|nr:uncharacterized protein CONPUDRAFT_147133 [Coniophora puteana RWD-64-598 SS2]EIW75494.1 hypothetical protein CONPUDRAFT_147133 [Coniophora puteana RWD-64-598 SS2]